MDKFAIDEGSILESKSNGWKRIVTDISVNELGITEIWSSEFWFDKKGKVKLDYETCADSELENIYIHYNLVGEDSKFFKKD